MTKTKLLIVDDEDDMLAELKRFLEWNGFEVALAADGVEALALVPKVHPDLIILDIKMPRLDGFGVMEHLRQAGNHIPIILLSQLTDRETKYSGLGLFGNELKADDYIDKPYDPLELVARVKTILHRTQRSAPPLDSFRQFIAGELTLIRQPPGAQLAGRTILASSNLKFRVLEYLMLHPHEIISRPRLFKDVWGLEWTKTRAVDLCITELRKALNEDADNPRFIRTINDEGYSFIVDVEGRM